MMTHYKQVPIILLHNFHFIIVVSFCDVDQNLQRYLKEKDLAVHLCLKQVFFLESGFNFIGSEF